MNDDIEYTFKVQRIVDSLINSLKTYGYVKTTVRNYVLVFLPEYVIVKRAVGSQGDVSTERNARTEEYLGSSRVPHVEVQQLGRFRGQIVTDALG
jgi:hypothetical protein